MRQLAVGVVAAWVSAALASPTCTLASTPVPTNMDLMVETTKAVVDDVLAEFSDGKSGLRAEAPVLIEAQSKHDANWLVEHLLIEALLERGFEVRVDTASAGQLGVRLTYRIIDLGISGWSGLMGGSVSRECRVTINIRVNGLADGTLRVQHEISKRLRDRIPKNRLEVLQNSNYDFADTELEEQSWGKFIEPAIVTTLLGSLIYLFFSNR